MNKEEQAQVEISGDEIKLKISAEDKRYIKRICQNDNINLDEKLDILTDHYQVTVEEMCERINSLGMSVAPTQFAAAKLHTLKKKKRYIISSAQTACPVNLGFLHNMEAYAKFIDAEIGIIATRYRNPTSIFKSEGDIWATEVQPYLTANRQQLHPDLLLLADLKIQATSPNPTSGVELFGGASSVIVGSPIIEMKSVAVLPTQKQKFLHSTGSVTIPSFTDTVAGGKAAKLHNYGCVIVEIENDNVVHIRNICAEEDGSFNDLIYRVSDGEVYEEDVETMVWGDSHFAQKDEQVTKAFRKVCGDLGVTTSVLHDVFDSQALNVHNLKNPIVQHQLMKAGNDDLQAELDQMYEELGWFEHNMIQTIVVSSNHDDMLDRAMHQGDWRDNLKNAVVFVDMLKLTLSGLAINGIIPFYINQRFKSIIALGTNDSYVKNGVELGLHGHKGSNGAKGSAKGLSKLSNPSIIGHSHTPSIVGDCYQVGITCGMDHGYNSGLTGWSYNSCTLNKHGKRQSITLNKETLTYTTLY